jgi:hypothetical protein
MYPSHRNSRSRQLSILHVCTRVPIGHVSLADPYKSTFITRSSTNYPEPPHTGDTSATTCKTVRWPQGRATHNVASPHSFKSQRPASGEAGCGGQSGRAYKRCDICTSAGSSAAPTPCDKQTSVPRDMWVDVRDELHVRLSLWCFAFISAV